VKPFCRPSISRKRFLSVVSLGGTAAFLSFRANIHAQSPSPPQIAPNSPPLDKELVKEFVIKGHADLAGTKALLEREPGLLNACWDWGGGDFETALEGAGHMGNKDIANFLLSKGARMNIFCAAMLGHLEVVKAILSAHPDLKTSKGPHGLQLLHHATKGGPDAAPVLEYLKSIGAQ
jgi:ankyrin repeat protein